MASYPSSNVKIQLEEIHVIVNTFLRSEHARFVIVAKAKIKVNPRIYSHSHLCLAFGTSST